MENFDLSKVDNVELDGITTNDYPDFSDVFILAADYNGKEMTEDELIFLQENFPDFVHEQIHNQLF